MITRLEADETKRKVLEKFSIAEPEPRANEPKFQPPGARAGTKIMHGATGAAPFYLSKT
jgi:hypothetical protein